MSDSDEEFVFSDSENAEAPAEEPAAAPEATPEGAPPPPAKKQKTAPKPKKIVTPDLEAIINNGQLHLARSIAQDPLSTGAGAGMIVAALNLCDPTLSSVDIISGAMVKMTNFIATAEATDRKLTAEKNITLEGEVKHADLKQKLLNARVALARLEKLRPAQTSAWLARLAEMTPSQLIFDLANKSEQQLLGLQTYSGPEADILGGSLGGGGSSGGGSSGGGDGPYDAKIENKETFKRATRKIKKPDGEHITEDLQAAANPRQE